MLSPCSSQPEDIELAVDRIQHDITLKNRTTQVSYDLGKGVFRIENTQDGTTVIRDAGATVNQSPFAGSARRTWKKAAVADPLGKGVALTITTPGDGLDLIQVFMLYEGRSSVVLQCGVRNTSPTPLRVKELVVMANARVWPGVIPEEPKTLDGMAGWDHYQETKTRVEDGTKRRSYNNLLYTFKDRGSRRSLVFGGLMYRDFATVASINGGTVRLHAEDPVGRLVDPGELYLPEDRYVLDGSQGDPFIALETYARTVAAANKVQPKAYTFPTVCAWYAFGYFHGKGGHFYDQNPDVGNNTPTCVQEIDIAGKAGFLNYAPVAIRLVPDKYMDNTVGLVDSQRVMGDTVDFKAEQVRRCGLRWYKCRTWFAYDMDAKALSTDREERRAMLTMAHVVSGRLLLGTSFANMSPEMVEDLARTFPYHTERKSARPIDMLQREMPMVYEFDVSGDWRQLCLYNGESTTEAVTVEVPLSGERADGALGLEPDSHYYLYDFWNDRFAGKARGSGTLRQALRGGEARMLSVHKVRDVPQFISTSRHLMQGYLDLVEKPGWRKDEGVLEGVSAVVAKAPYELVFACNGRIPVSVQASQGDADLGWKDQQKGIAVLTLKTADNADVRWKVRFE